MKNTVLVVGGGPAGMQASLVMAARGHKVVLADKAPAAGGLFPLLDNQFPTQSCGVCFMACDTPTYCPFVQCDLHENVTLLPSSTVSNVSGEAGDFTIDFDLKATCVDPDKCTDCGACEAVCPVEVQREFGDGLETRKAIYRYYPKSVGKGYVVDRENCTNCGECVKVCDPDAIDLDARDSTTKIDAAAVILSPGAKLYKAGAKGEFGFGRYDNVLSSAKFERMLAAGSPTGGRVVRPSDSEEAKSLAFIQCVGSRDPANGRPHCSSVCCMFALKQALFTKKRHPEMAVTIYYMDLRAFGKDYENYLREAEKAGIEFVRAMPSVARLNPATSDMLLAVTGEDGKLTEQTHSMVVLASGFDQDEDTASLCAAFGLGCDSGGLLDDMEFDPCATAVPGVFAAGAFRGPKDIPDSVQEGATAAAMAAKLLDAGEFAELAACPTPVDFREEAPRTGVVLCDCEGYNSALVDFDALSAEVANIADVDFVERCSHACSKVGMDEVRSIFATREPNRLVLATCSHHIVEDLYKHMFKQMGVHSAVVDIADLRFACRSGEVDSAKATVANAVTSAHANVFSPVNRQSAQRSAVVIGGGAAGMSSALALAELGHPVHLIEKSDKLGGNLNTAAYTIKGNDPRALAAELVEKVEAHPEITVYTSSRVSKAAGRIGAYRTTVEAPDSVVEVLHGATLLATGASEAEPKSFGYGESPRVITQKQLEGKLASGQFEGGNVVMIQCVESRRTDEGCREYCSRVCCTHAVKNAEKLLELSPDTEITVLYRDLRTYSNFERNYQSVREKGVLFTSYTLDDEPQVDVGGEKIKVVYTENSINEKVTAEVDWLVLSVGMEPDVADVARLAGLFGVESDKAGFFIEKNPKAATTDFAKPGMYVAGLAHAPKHIEESIVQARAAGARLAAVLATGEVQAPVNPSFVVDKICSRCGLCVDACPYGARELDMEANVAVVDEIVCRACGACVTACPNKAARQYGSSPGQIMAALDELL